TVNQLIIHHDIYTYDLSTFVNLKILKFDCCVSSEEKTIITLPLNIEELIINRYNFYEDKYSLTFKNASNVKKLTLLHINCNIDWNNIPPKNITHLSIMYITWFDINYNLNFSNLTHLKIKRMFTENLKLIPKSVRCLTISYLDINKRYRDNNIIIIPKKNTSEFIIVSIPSNIKKLEIKRFTKRINIFLSNVTELII